MNELERRILERFDRMRMPEGITETPRAGDTIVFCSHTPDAKDLTLATLAPVTRLRVGAQFAVYCNEHCAPPNRPHFVVALRISHSVCGHQKFAANQ